MLPNVGMGELLVILALVLLLFGAKRLPEVAKGLGRSIRSFKEGLKESLEDTSSVSSESSADVKEEAKPVSRSK